MSEEVLVDTNVIIRLLVDDGSKQSWQARKWWKEVEEGDFKVLVVESVLPEISYVMEKGYKLKRERYVPWVEELLAMPGVKVVGWTREGTRRLCEMWRRETLDLVDLMLILRSKMEKKRLISFDRKVVKSVGSGRV